MAVCSKVRFSNQPLAEKALKGFQDTCRRRGSKVPTRYLLVRCLSQLAPHVEVAKPPGAVGAEASDRSCERQCSGRESLSLLAPQSAGLAGRLDRRLFDCSDGTFELVRVAGADGYEAGYA